MMGRYPGTLTTDVYGEVIEELKIGTIDFGAPAAADDDGILNDATTDDADEVTYEESDFLAQPDIPRGLKFTPSASADAGNIEVEGLDYEGKPISELIATNTTNAVTSVYAYKKVTKITFPVDDAEITWDVGWDDRLGLPFKFSEKPMTLEYSDGALKTTSGTFAVDDETLAKNTFDPNTTLNETNKCKLVLFL